LATESNDLQQKIESVKKVKPGKQSLLIGMAGYDA
jgi:hypothetical protein